MLSEIRNLALESNWTLMKYICDFPLFSKSYDGYDLREGKYSKYLKTFF